MTIQGTIRNGLVELEGAPPLPDGTKVCVFVAAPELGALSLAAEVARQKAALAELLSMPDENPNDTFCAADKDRVLYGELGISSAASLDEHFRQFGSIAIVP
jgi:hypothetical protein